MIIYLHGPDSCRRLQKQKEIINEYNSKHSGLTVKRFYLTGVDDEIRQLKDSLGFQSLFGGSQLIAISGVANFKKQTAIAELLKNVAKDKKIFIILSEDKKLGKDFTFLNRKPTLSQEFDNLSGNEFKNFIIREAKKRGVELFASQEILSSLTNAYEGDSWGVINELEKMALNTNFQLPITNYQSIINEPIFKKIYRFKSRNISERLKTLETLLLNEDSAKVFNLIAYSVGDKNKFADYDVAIKTGKIEYDMALLDWVIS